jgi:hypothetical protein
MGAKVSYAWRACSQQFTHKVGTNSSKDNDASFVRNDPDAVQQSARAFCRLQCQTGRSAIKRDCRMGVRQHGSPPTSVVPNWNGHSPLRMRKDRPEVI